VPFSSPEHYYNRARALAESTPGGVWGNQFESTVNARSHYETTGPEMWAQAGAAGIDALALAAGTGGTIAGKLQVDGALALGKSPIQGGRFDAVDIAGVEMMIASPGQVVQTALSVGIQVHVFHVSRQLELRLQLLFVAGPANKQYGGCVAQQKSQFIRLVSGVQRQKHQTGAHASQVNAQRLHRFVHLHRHPVAAHTTERQQRIRVTARHLMQPMAT
jgi:hypothetical protein